jgi:hypothetical protein
MCGTGRLGLERCRNVRIVLDASARHPVSLHARRCRHRRLPGQRSCSSKLNRISPVQSWLRRARMVSAGESGTEELVQERVAEWRGASGCNLAIGRDRTRPEVRLGRWFCWLVVIALMVVAALAWPVAAHADPVNLNPCNDAALSQPFAPWADVSRYELAPGGDFESLDWSFQGGAQLVAGSEPYAATGELGGFSVSLPHGASVESPLTCVDAAYPSIRLFIAGTGSVGVDVLSGNLDIPCGVAVAGGRWLPTPVMVTSSALMAALSGGTAEVSLRLKALSGNPQVDDVWVDPWNRG